jgi:hypothetical protein
MNGPTQRRRSLPEIGGDISNYWGGQSLFRPPLYKLWGGHIAMTVRGEGKEGPLSPENVYNCSITSFSILLIKCSHPHGNV